MPLVTGGLMADLQDALPNEFFTVVHINDGLAPKCRGICAGFELGTWRAEQLAAALLEWLPEFALTHSERTAIGSHNAVRLVKQAARSIYQTDKYSKRGEFGEIILHACIRQLFRTLPAISKIYFKDSANDTVKGFDCVQVRVVGNEMELWLGETKFYTEAHRAIRDVVEELKAHSNRDYLRNEFTFVKNKIDSGWPHAHKLQQLIDPHVSLDEVFSRTVFPVLLTYDSEVVKAHTELCDKYLADIAIELNAHHELFRSQKLPEEIVVVLVLFPMRQKVDLVSAMDRLLRGMQ